VDSLLCIKDYKPNFMKLMSYQLLEKLVYKRSKLKYLINFRKTNQTRFYY